MNDLQLNIADEAKTVLPYARNYFEVDGGIGILISGILSFVLVIAFLLVLFYLIMGAIEWITSAGDKGKVEKARDKMTQSIIGVIVLVSVLAIMSLLQNFLGVQIFNLPSSSNSGNYMQQQTGTGRSAPIPNTLNGALGPQANPTDRR